MKKKAYKNKTKTRVKSLPSLKLLEVISLLQNNSISTIDKSILNKKTNQNQYIFQDQKGAFFL